jgi:hypothetical protein
MTGRAFVSAIVLVGAISGCDGNNTPRILSFNGREVKTDFWGNTSVSGTWSFAPGDVLPFSVEVLDPDGDDTQLWWPKAPPGFDFPPDGTTGTWAVPDDFDVGWWVFYLVVVDDAPEPAGRTLQVTYGDGDTGFGPPPLR